jgi:hypothetical protein
MARIVLTDGTSRWFESDSAEAFEEDTRWNGNNHVSLATGSWTDHETLYRTAGKKWIVYHWSQWQGSMPTNEEISDEEAAAWLVRNGYEHPDAAEQIAALEIR